jgi:hypothetical protein
MAQRYMPYKADLFQLGTSFALLFMELRRDIKRLRYNPCSSASTLMIID